MVINGLLGHLSNVAHTFLEAYNVGGFDLLNKGRLIIVANSNTLLEISRLVVMVMTFQSWQTIAGALCLLKAALSISSGEFNLAFENLCTFT